MALPKTIIVVIVAARWPVSLSLDFVLFLCLEPLLRRHVPVELMVARSLRMVQPVPSVEAGCG